MAVLAGIDEAGFGPILGPLVVSSSTFSLPDESIKSDLWQILNKSVGQTRRALAGRLLITDSKKAHTKSQGIKHLQRTTLACLKCLGSEPKRLRDLITVLCPQCLERLDEYPWHNETEKFEISADEMDIAIASEVFAKDMTSKGVKLLGLNSRCLDVAHYNELVDNIRNKSNVLFGATSELIFEAWQNHSRDGLQIVVDRQGGRVHYRQQLQRLFPRAELTILKETPANSSYELREGPKMMKLHFAVKADNRFLPVSLASMVSKYLRELLVGNINRYFRSFHPDIKPTAGYWQDGLRFIEDINSNIPEVRYETSRLIRCR